MNILPPIQVASLRQQFSGMLQRLKMELQGNLERIDLLNRQQVEQTLDLFNQRLVVVQHELLEHLAAATNRADGKPAAIPLQCVKATYLPETAAAVVAGGGAAVLTKLITFTGSSWYFWTVSTSLASVIGSAVGVSAGIATAGVGVGVGAVAGLGVYRLLSAGRRKRIREAILQQYDYYAVPHLQAWAAYQMEEAAKELAES